MLMNSPYVEVNICIDENEPFRLAISLHLECGNTIQKRIIYHYICNRRAKVSVLDHSFIHSTLK